MTDRSILLEQVQRHWQAQREMDLDGAHAIYHDDAVLEFPQSGERFEGVANFKEWRSQYPADVSYRIRRMTTGEDSAAVEVSVSYNGGPWQYGVQLLEFRGDRVARERIYVTEAWDAPEWRAPWRSTTPADPTTVTDEPT
jgi:ketosteroid isomerase-like protein